MALFDVPGWSVPSVPKHDIPSQVSKKRKRPSTDHIKIDGAEINFDKLMKKLESDTGGGKAKKGKKKQQTDNEAEKKQKQLLQLQQLAKTVENPKKFEAVRKHVSRTKSRISGKLKVTAAGEDDRELQNSIKRGKESQSVQDDSSGLTALQKGMRHSLEGARFRLINEQLYKSDSKEAYKLMQDDVRVYHEYHDGFRYQVQAWPNNPVQHYISHLSLYSPKTVVADLGCGDAAMARTLIPKGMTVISFDLCSDGVYIVEADICSRIPLPGSEGNEKEKTSGEGQIVDVVVCALSLMATNWPNCLREAWRVLKAGGELKIAEVASRFTDVEQFIALIGSIGFRLHSKDDSNTYFTLFEFRKVPRKNKSEKEWRKIVTRGSILKPCEYKRR